MVRLSLLSQKIVMASLCYFTFQFGSAVAEEPPLSPQESIKLKRIVAYWKDGDFRLAKKQILSFLSEFEKSPVKDRLLAMLGDLYFHEKSYSDAITAYAQITEPEFKEKVFVKQLKSFLELKEFAKAEEAAVSVLKTKRDDLQQSQQITLILAEALYKQDKLKEALPYLEMLYDLPAFKEEVRVPLAACYQAAQDYSKAASLYRLLFHKENSKQEEILYQIALCESFYNKTAALQTFGELAEMGGAKKEEALFQQIVLLFELKRYSETIESCQKSMDLFSQDKKAIAIFYLGECSLAVKDYVKARETLQKYTQNPLASSLYLKTALIHLMVCAKELQDGDLSTATLGSLSSLFPSEPEHLQAILINADLQKKADALTLTEKEFETLLNLSSFAVESEKTLYNYGLLLAEEKRWKESGQLFSFFIDKYPSSPYSKASWRVLLNCSMQEMKNFPEDIKKKELFVADLAKALNQQEIFTPEEKAQFHFIYIKSLYELQKYELCLEQANLFHTSFPKDPNGADAHLIAALCHEELLGNLEQAIDHFETALSLSPFHADSLLIYLHLYNDYLALAAKNETTRAVYHEKAAYVLYEAFINKQQPIKLDNQIWLATYFYGVARNPNNQLAFHHATTLYDRIFSSSLKPEELLSLEDSAQRYLELLTIAKDDQKKSSFLSGVTQIMSQHPETQWTMERQFLFSLAQSYERLNEARKALVIFEGLIDKEGQALMSDFALLHKCKLQFALIAPEDKIDSAEVIIEILNNLKDLQLNRSAQTEPLHLEAALEYVEIRTLLAAKEEALDKRLFFLKRVQEDFTAIDEPCQKEYAKALAANPDKKALFESYMDYVAAEIAALESAKARQAGEDQLSAERSKEAAELLNRLQKANAQLTPYLRDKIEKDVALNEGKEGAKR